MSPVVIKLDARRRLTVPASLALIRPGDVFEAEFDPDADAIVFRRLVCKGDWLAMLERCPIAMDNLPARRRETFRSKL